MTASAKCPTRAQARVHDETSSGVIYNPRMQEKTISQEKLTVFAAACLEKLGLLAADARLVADTLVAANLRGVDSHGIVRLPHYATRLRNGTIKARPAIRVQRTG